MNDIIQAFKRGFFSMVTGALLGLFIGFAVAAACGSFIPGVTDLVNEKFIFAADIGQRVAEGVTEDVGQAVGDGVASGIVGAILGPIVGAIIGFVRGVWYAEF